MEKETKNLEDLKNLTAGFLNTLKPISDDEEIYTAEIKFINYYELGCVITNMLKLCILAIDQETHKITETNKNSSINVGLILEVALQLFPMDEFELLSNIIQKLNTNSETTPTV
ncbi:hypothetical protein SAMN05444671_3868 [Flavobacterium sp. CF108]|uniref:hypothetical protein n=1 Tax=unclassified Flavobacterium TaxID=196869 RepID=UPI0008CF833B|nr:MULTISPECIES: hypothetical protein [unclassified Flavobacterium]SEO96419.1 hypothetical protein SAMN04487978_4103 [Flavobacterium sp. fv08]SHH81425.1 hypothetical protein SAMN05444671_3868 [Flavobacterium sp. CF108]